LAPVVASGSWLQYHFNNAGDGWIIFALETHENQPPRWRRIHSSWGYGETAMYGIYKTGAAWEVHTGKRLIQGKSVKVEKYLSEIAKLPLVQLSDLGDLRPIARKTLDERGLEHIDSYYGHQWDKSSWDMSLAAECGPFTIPLNSRPNLTFLQQVSGPSEVYLETQSGSLVGRPSETMELFA
jgi:hypothetical protein